jgi:hypothetical protein
MENTGNSGQLLNGRKKGKYREQWTASERQEKRKIQETVDSF